MKKSIPLCLILASCSMYRTSTIQNDIENKNKVIEIQQKIDSDTALQDTDLAFQTCQNQITQLRSINQKTSLNDSDINIITSVFNNSDIHQIDCTSKAINKKTYIKEFNKFCSNKYSRPNNAVLGLLAIPIVATNGVLHILTLGIFPWFFDGGIRNTNTCEIFSKQFVFPEAQKESFSQEEANHLTNLVNNYCQNNKKLAKQSGSICYKEAPISSSSTEMTPETAFIYIVHLCKNPDLYNEVTHGNDKELIHKINCFCKAFEGMSEGEIIEKYALSIDYGIPQYDMAFRFANATRCAENN